MTPTSPRLALATFAAGILLITIFAVMIGRFRAELRAEINQEIIERDATVLYPMAEQQLAETDPGGESVNAETLLPSVLKSKQQDGMLAVTIFDALGSTLQAVGASLLLADLPPGDYPRLLGDEHLSRYHPDFPLDQYFTGIKGPPGPVLEVLLPLHAPNSRKILGFVQYYIDARRLRDELAVIDRRVNQQTLQTLAIAATLIAAVLTAGYFGLNRAQRMIAERNERLTRANFELTLAAKTSALGLITSHLIHGLQGPVAGLRAVMADHGVDGSVDPAGWQSASDYAERMQVMIQETVALLGDAGSQTTYELTGRELAEIIRSRNAESASARGVVFTINEGFRASLDSHRGGLLCLIATNLVQNAIAATEAGRRVDAVFACEAQTITLVVKDEGGGIPDSVGTHLFEPGRTGRPGGTGLGLAISQLLARQIGATLALEATSSSGTTFRLSLPLS
jgi:signal transduction histidine kinase